MSLSPLQPLDTLRQLAIHRSLGRLALLAIFALLAGCGVSGISSDYGGVEYPTKNSSINGLGIFMKLCSQAGSRCFVAHRLSSRLEKADAILLVGNTFHPPAKEARDWLEAWLGAKAGRTVVYFGRDFDAEIFYRQRTLADVPAAQRHRAEVELAMARTTLDTLWQGEIDEDAFCRWFHIKLHEPRVEIRDFVGPWSRAITDSSSNDRATALWPVRIRLEPPQKSQAKDKPKWLSTAPSTRTLGNSRQATQPPNKAAKKPRQKPSQRPSQKPNPQANPQAEEDESEADQPELFRSVWVATDIGDPETWREEWAKVPQVEVLLAGRDGTPLVTKLTSPRYAGSQILAVANGAPLLNGSIVQPHFRQAAHHLIDALQPAKRIALVPFDAQGLVISNVHEDDQIAGLSVLTTWPMNIIVAHLAFLGVLICLALFPILGRPQALPSASRSDFGQHAEALGRMLQRRGDVRHALRVAADYYRAVRGEAPPGWLKSAFQPAQPVEPPALPVTSGEAAPPSSPNDSSP